MISILSVFAPIQSVLVTLAVLVTADFITGVWAAVRRKEPITSAQMRRSLSKIICYELVVAISFLSEKYLIGDVLPLTKMVVTLISLVELKSLMENVSTITGTNILSAIINKLGSANQEIK